MTKKTKLISEDVFLKAEQELKKLGSAGRVSNRLRAIASSYKHGIKQVSEIMDISSRSIHKWVRLFREKGVEGLYDAGKPPRSKFDEKQKNVIKRWLEASPTTTLKELAIKINKEWGSKVGKSSIHRAIVSLGFAHITGRPKHHKSDDLKQEAFKKNFKI